MSTEAGEVQDERKLVGALGNKVLCSPSALAKLRKLRLSELGRSINEGLLEEVLHPESIDSPQRFVSYREQWLLKSEAEFAQATAGEFARLLL